MFRVRLLAGTSIDGPHGPLSGAALQRHRIALLALVLGAPNRTMSRDKLVAYLWPDSDAARARHLLRSALHVLRQVLGDDAIVAMGDDLRINPSVITSDVGEFLDAIERDDYERAVALYAGPFLDGFHVNDAPELDRWIDAERNRLERLQRDALERLAESAEQRRDVAAAVAAWHRLAAADPYSSRIALGLMRSLELGGDRAAAIRHARVHEHLLQEELGAEADPDVVALAERLRMAPVLRGGGDNGRSAELRVPQDANTAEPEVESVSLVALAAQPLPVPGAHTLPVVATPAATRKRRRTLFSAGAIAVLGATVVGALVMLWPRVAGRPANTGAIASVLPRSGAASVAVLPFTNLGGDPEQEYFSDGLTEELIATLARVRSLRVAARTSVFAFKGEARDIRGIGRELNVGTLLEGTVRKEGDRIRVHAQLIDASNGFHLWSQTYERRLEDIFALQTELALRIAEALQTELTPAERERIGRRPTESIEAHTAYLKGRYFWKKRSGGALATAINYFERAIAADPQYARAYAGLASVYGPMGVHGFLPPRDARQRMRAAVFRALEIDPDLAEGRTALGAYLHTSEWDFPRAEKEFLRAIELDPDEPTAHTWYGHFLESMQRGDEAVVQRRTAAMLDPMAAMPNSGLGSALWLNGQADLAVEHLSNALDLDSTYWLGHYNLGEAYLTRGDLARAIAAFESAIKHAGKIPRPKAGLASALARARREPEARRILEALRAEAAQTGVHAPVIAIVFVALLEPDSAFSWLEQSYRERHPDLPHTLAHPAIKTLRDDPRFQDLRRRVGIE